MQVRFGASNKLESNGCRFKMPIACLLKKSIIPAGQEVRHRMKARRAGSGAGSTVAAIMAEGSPVWQFPASKYAMGENAKCEMVPSAFITLQGRNNLLLPHPSQALPDQCTHVVDPGV